MSMREEIEKVFNSTYTKEFAIVVLEHLLKKAVVGEI
jgi:hypothetical protein